MGISTSPSLWMGDKGGRYYIRAVGSSVYWLGLHKDGLWANVFAGTLFGKSASGYWAELAAAKGAILKGGKLSLSLSASEIKVTYQTGKFPEKKLTPSSMKPFPFPKFAS